MCINFKYAVKFKLYVGAFSANRGLKLFESIIVCLHNRLLEDINSGGVRQENSQGKKFSLSL